MPSTEDENTPTSQEDPSQTPNQETNNDESSNNEDESESSETEEDEEEPTYHPHKGRILGIKQYNVINNLSYDKGYDSPTGNGKVELLLDNDDKKYVYCGVACKLKVRRSTDRQFSDTGIEEVYKKEEDIQLREHYPTPEMLIENNSLLVEKEFGEEDLKDFDVDEVLISRSASDDGLYGFVTEVTHSQKTTDLNLKDWGLCLEDTSKKLEFNNLLRSHIIEEVIKSYGLVPIVDFTGLDDDLTSWTNMKSTGKGTSGSSSDNGGDVSVNGDGSMTEDQAWEIYKTFKYGGWGSGHDPQKAWEKMGTTKGTNADCYDATAWLYYVYNYKIGIPARDICYPSAAARNSGTHHIVQIYKNGKWFVPEQYHGITSGLGGSEQEQYHVCREPPKNGNQPSYERCPWSRND